MALHMTKRKATIVICFAIALLTTGTVWFAQEIDFVEISERQTVANQEEVFNRSYLGSHDLTQLLANRTFLLVKSPRMAEYQSGNSIVYYDPSGRRFAWYQGYRKLLSGLWAVRSRWTVLYSKHGWRFVTRSILCELQSISVKQDEGTCQVVASQDNPLNSWADVTSGDGDIFGLASRTTVPFELSAGNLTLQGLRDQLRTK